MRVTLLNLFDRHGGAETCVRSLLHGMKEQGHTVRLLVGRQPRAADPDVACLPRFWPEFVLQRFLSRLTGLTDTTLLLPLWQASRHPDLAEADLVHAHVLNGSYFNLWALPILTRRTPVVVTLHDMWLLTGDCDHSEDCIRWEKQCGACPMMRRPRGQRNSVGWADLTRLNLAIKRAAFRRVRPDRLVVTAPSHWMARLAARSHLGRFRIEVIPNGLDLGRYHDGDPMSARRAFDLPTEPHLFLAVAGNWKNPHKGGNLLPSLASGLQAMGQARLVVVGKLPAALADSLKQAGAIVAGSLQDPDALRQYYSACDATLLLSRNENFPYVVSESLACGCPVIARAVGGVPEMLEQGVSGILISPRAGPLDFLRAVQSMMRQPTERRVAFRRAARRRAERLFDLAHSLRAYEMVYRQLVNSGPRRGRAAA